MKNVEAFKMQNSESSGIRQFLMLLYKGLLLRKRHFIVTIFEIVIPVFIASIPAIVESEISSRGLNLQHDNKPDWVNATVYKPFDPLNISRTSKYSEVIFLYAPATTIVENFVNDTIEFWKSSTKFEGKIQIASYTKEGDLENASLMKRRSKQSADIIGTVFNSFDPNRNKIDYKIRYGSPYGRNKFFNKLRYRVNGPQKNDAYTDTYFLSWQAAIERTFINQIMAEKGKTMSYQLWMQRFPYPRHKENADSFSSVSIVPWLIGFGFLIFLINLMRRVIEEKSNGSKELMKMMGMTDLLYWSSTFVNYFGLAALAVFIISIIYKSPLKNSFVFLKYTDFFLLFFLLLLFMAQLVLFSLAFTTFFNRAVFGIIALIIAYDVSLSLLATKFFLIDMEINYFPLPLISKLSICLLPTGSLLTVFLIVSQFEASGEGARWSNLTEYGTNPDLNLLMVIGMTLFSCFIYAVCIWYVDAVWPWQYGVPKPFYFPFTKSYWCNVPPKEFEEADLFLPEEKNSEFFEDDPSGMTPGVVIHNLSKAFRSGLQRKLVVNNVSLKIYNGQITALLGHNGAGKTTTINMLTGLYAPSSGTASINGYNILTQTTKARRSLGVCPQHNVLFDTLTVEEHLKIYAGLKGVAWNKFTSEAFDIMKMLNLTNKKNELIKNLSGGMKRKLCLGIAIIGGSRVLFLDEPTAGMDAEARRSVWDALLQLRTNRTIILTTHYMEEADILGDRIAIMAEGEIECCGSPIFLKRKFGTGYHLHIVKDNSFNLENLTELLNNYIPDVNVENDSEKQVTFILSNVSNVGTSFGQMFEELESNKKSLGISSCGITVTTMEDVFLNVANISNMKVQNKENALKNGIELEVEDSLESGVDPKHNGAVKMIYKMFALLMKRLNYAKRHWSILVNQLIIPFLIICGCMYTISSTSRKSSNTYSSLKIDINHVYGKTDGFFHAINESAMKLFSEKLQNEFIQNQVNLKRTENPTEMVLNYAKQDFSGYLKRLLVGSSTALFDNGSMYLVAWYNGEPFHVTPMSLLIMDTAILRYITGSDSASITLTNAPLPYASEYFNSDFSRLAERMYATVFIPMALAFLSASYVMVPIHERSSKAKLLQLMTGIPASIYWFTMFMWDFFVHTVICVFLIIPFAIFSHYAFFSPHSDAIGTSILMTLLYGWSSIPFSYLISFIFKKPNTGFSVVVSIHILTGVVFGSIITSIMAGMRDFMPSGLKAAIWVMRLFPSFAVSFGFSNLFAIAYDNVFCDQISPQDYSYYCTLKEQSYNPVFKCCKDICGSQCLNQTHPITWDYDACGRDILFLALDGCIYFALLLFVETGIFKVLIRTLKCQLSKLKKSIVGEISRDSYPEDSDVLQEESRIENIMHLNSCDEALIVYNLTKVYKNFYAVDHLTFGVHKEECFGLLGVNGAGKTTTFRILTGDCYPTEGNATYNKQYFLTTSLKKFQSFIGYCPQFDALIDRLTGREMITLFGRLRGLSGRTLVHKVNNLISMTDLLQHADKQTMLYSGGNKRKLSIAIALIGSPPLILLDEPTAGVDPVSRRKIWTALSQARSRMGAAIILTTHSMEECEALCNRLAIMVNGRFRCLGPIQQLKSKFGQGYTLVIKLKREAQNNPQSVIAVKNFIEAQLTGAQLKDDHQGMLQYHIVDSTITLSHIFKFMDEMKPKFDLEDYLISDTSLEQIFLSFARAQRVVG